MDELVNEQLAQDQSEQAAGLENTATQTENTEVPNGEETPAEKTFTQAELDAILEKKTAKLIRQREQERAKREQLEQRLPREVPTETGRPQLHQFNNDPDAYAEAVADWKLQQRELQSRQQEVQKSASAFEAKRDDLIAELEESDGYDAGKFNKLPISPVMAEAIVDSDQATRLALHLIAHPEDANRISNLPPARQAAEIGKLEAKLSTAPPKKPSNAPDPINPVGGKGNAVSADIYDPKLANDTEAWIAARNKQVKARR